MQREGRASSRNYCSRLNIRYNRYCLRYIIDSPAAAFTGMIVVLSLGAHGVEIVFRECFIIMQVVDGEWAGSSAELGGVIIISSGNPPRWQSAFRDIFPSLFRNPK